MAITIASSTTDTPKIIEDKVRNLPANQGLNDHAMWLKVDSEVAAARVGVLGVPQILENESYVPANKHGAK